MDLAAAETRRKSISEGVGFIGKIVGALSILEMLGHAIAMPMSQWLNATLRAYGALFHSLVDHTVGLVPRLFGLEFVPVVKDLIVLYMVGGAALVRVAVANVRHFDGGEMLRRPRYLRAFVYSFVVWPILLRTQFRLKRQRNLLRRERPELFRALPPEKLEDYEKASRNVRLFRIELISVIAIVIAAIIFNAAGEL